MKKKLSILLIGIIIFASAPVYALNVGTYKTETEYGLLDGFKVNWKRKDKSQPFIEPREESTKQEKEKELQYYKEDEYEYTKNMYKKRTYLVLFFVYIVSYRMFEVRVKWNLAVLLPQLFSKSAYLLPRGKPQYMLAEIYLVSLTITPGPKLIK